MNNTPPQTTAEFLHAALRALNEFPNKKLDDNPYINSYALAQAIERHLGSLSTNPQTRDCVHFVVYTIEDGKQQEYIFKHVDELTARRECLDNPTDVKETQDIIRSATKICIVEGQETFVEDGGVIFASIDNKPPKEHHTGFTTITIRSGRNVTHEKESIVTMANRLELCFDLQNTRSEKEIIEFANVLHYPPR